MSKVLDHVHTYAKSPRNKNFYRCRDSHCSHYKHRKDLEGKASLCNLCGIEFVLSWYSLTLAKPRCPACSTSKKGKQLTDVKTQLEEILRNQVPGVIQDDLETRETQPLLELTVDDMEIKDGKS